MNEVTNEQRRASADIAKRIQNQADGILAIKGPSHLDARALSAIYFALVVRLLLRVMDPSQAAKILRGFVDLVETDTARFRGPGG